MKYLIMDTKLLGIYFNKLTFVHVSTLLKTTSIIKCVTFHKHRQNISPIKTFILI